MTDTELVGRLESIERRLDRVEARADLAALVTRYARAADARDIDALVGLYVEDVDCGRRGRGRAVLHEQLSTILREFYRSVHFVCGQVIDELSEQTATGTTYCLAQQQMRSGWISLAVRYEDRFANDGSSWRFTRRVPRIWYVAPAHDGTADPHELWPELRFRLSLPDELATWSSFWAQSRPADDVP